MSNDAQFINLSTNDGERPPADVLNALRELAEIVATFEGAAPDDDVSGFGFKPGPVTPLGAVDLGGGSTGPYDAGPQDWCLKFSDGGDSSSCWIDWTK